MATDGGSIALSNFHRYSLTFFQGLKPFHLNCRMMNEHILRSLALDKSETLGIVEPFYGSTYSFA